MEEVFVEQGQHVNKGQPIARLLLKDFELAVQEKTALRVAAEEQLKQLKEGTRKKDLVVAESAYREARVRTEYWRTELKRRSRLYDQGPVSASEVEHTRRERDAAIEREQMAKAEWERAAAGPRRQTVAAAIASVRAAEAAENIARRQLEKATLVAPFDGRVERRVVDPGCLHQCLSRRRHPRRSPRRPFTSRYRHVGPRGDANQTSVGPGVRNMAGR